jgi:hypothetical protein
VRVAFRPPDIRLRPRSDARNRKQDAGWLDSAARAQPHLSVASSATSRRSYSYGLPSTIVAAQPTASSATARAALRSSEPADDPYRAATAHGVSQSA